MPPAIQAEIQVAQFLEQQQQQQQNGGGDGGSGGGGGGDMFVSGDDSEGGGGDVDMLSGPLGALTCTQVLGWLAS